MVSTRPSRQLTLDFGNDSRMSHCGIGVNAGLEPQGGQSCAAIPEKSALDSLSMTLMEQVVDLENMERAWKKGKANGGAPGPDGITLKQFPEHIRPLWPELRQQLLDGTYRPEAARRKAIAKPDGGERMLDPYQSTPAQNGKEF